MARRALAEDPLLPAQACFHAQQAAEKALKAVLVRENLPVPRIHQLEKLLDGAGRFLRNAKSLRPLIEGLSEYAVKSRYPFVRGALPDVREARTALARVEQLVKLISQALQRPARRR